MDFYDVTCLRISEICVIFAANIQLKYIFGMKTGDNVLISPEVTHKSDWTRGTVIDVEANPFVGTVISAETPNGEIYFDKEYQFKLAI